MLARLALVHPLYGLLNVDLNPDLQCLDGRGCDAYVVKLAAVLAAPITPSGIDFASGEPIATRSG